MSDSHKIYSDKNIAIYLDEITFRVTIDCDSLNTAKGLTAGLALAATLSREGYDAFIKRVGHD